MDEADAELVAEETDEIRLWPPKGTVEGSRCRPSEWMAGCELDVWLSVEAPDSDTDVNVSQDWFDSALGDWGLSKGPPGRGRARRLAEVKGVG